MQLFPIASGKRFCSHRSGRENPSQSHRLTCPPPRPIFVLPGSRRIPETTSAMRCGRDRGRSVSSSSPERRRHDRRSISSNGSNPLVATIGVVPRAALINDIGPGGISLLSTDPPPVDSIVPLWLAVPIGSPSRLIFVRLVHVSPAGGDLYRIGAAAVDEATVEILRELVDLL